jgi:hypothetical protein
LRVPAMQPLNPSLCANSTAARDRVADLINTHMRILKNELVSSLDHYQFHSLLQWDWGLLVHPSKCFLLVQL